MIEPGVIALVAHARSVPASERQRFASRLRDLPAPTPMVFETCHRVEAYLVLPGDRRDTTRWLPADGQILRGEVAVRHAIAVAAGRDSVVVGEDQILHQLREAVDRARADGGLDPALDRLFAVALRAGRRARSWRSGPPRSLADVALAAIARQTGELRGRDVLVVGAGRMGRLAARAMVAANARVSVASRSREHARAVAAESAAHVEDMDPGARIDGFSGIVVALGGPWLIGRAAVEALASGSMVVVDLSVPGAVDGALAAALGSRFVSADALALADPQDAGLDQPTLARLDALIDASAMEFLTWLRGREGRTAARALSEQADLERRAQLDDLWRRVPGLGPEARDAIDDMTRRLMTRLLREPVERLGRDVDGRQERAARELFGL